MAQHGVHVKLMLAMVSILIKADIKNMSMLQPSSIPIQYLVSQEEIILHSKPNVLLIQNHAQVVTALSLII